MRTSTLRRALALTTTVTLLAGLVVITTGAPAAAQLTCDGRLVTMTDNDGNDQNGAVGVIEGTAGPDVILGTDGDDKIYGLAGRDRICGGEGDDEILGGGGNDRLFGGSDDDDVSGGPGHDDLFGFTGNDVLIGGDGRDFVKGGGGGDTIRGNGKDDVLQGNGGTDWIKGGTGFDRIDGGAAADDCSQGPRIRRCERADLKVTVIGPPSPAPDGEIKFRVKVKNLGPDLSSYVVDLEEHGGNTQGGGFQPVVILGDPLRSGRVRTHVVTVFAEIQGPDPWTELVGEVGADARDPRKGNDRDSSGRIDLE